MFYADNVKRNARKQHLALVHCGVCGVMSA